MSRAQLPRFYFNRAVRIWAPYYLALAFLIAASLLKGNVVDSKWLEFVGYKLTFVYNLFGPSQLSEFRARMPLEGTGNHFWSVNAEEQFYLLAPLILVVAASRYGRKPLTWVAIAVVAWLMDHYASIAFGVLASVVQVRHPGFHHKASTRALLLVVVVASTALFVSTPLYRSVAPFCSVALVLLLALPGARSSVGQFAGGLSYPLYLNHWIGGFAATVLMIPLGLRHSAIEPILGMVLSLLLAASLYWGVDRRLLARRGDFYSAARGRHVMVIAYAMVLLGLIFAALVHRNL